MKFPTKCVKCGGTSNTPPGFLRVLQWMKDNGRQGRLVKFKVSQIAKGLTFSRQRAKGLISMAAAMSTIYTHAAPGSKKTLFSLANNGRKLLLAWEKVTK